MARASKEIVQAAIMGFGIPVFLLLIVILFLSPDPPQQPEPTVPDTTESVQTRPTLQPYFDTQIKVIVDDEPVMMDLETYVLGAVLSEMPASFEMEALKAQAVACRTYGLLMCQNQKKHSGAVCDGHGCCQGYMTREDYLQRGWSEKYIERVRQAVDDTRAQVLTFDGKLIRATYFSCSGGATESALTVWGRDYPYLQSVESPGEEETVYYTSSRCFTLEEFQNVLGVSLSGSPETWFGSITYTSGGGIETIQIGGVTYRGTTLRALLSLRSTAFQLVVSPESILFQTRGNGHRVGMSQYGADAMAELGSTYEQILSHYYVGTQLFDYRLLEN